MNCDTAHLLVQAYADGELDVGNSLALEEHAKDCLRCTTAMQNTEALRRVFANAPNLRHSAPLRLQSQIRRALGGNANHQRRTANQLWKWLALAATATAVVTLTLRSPGISEHDELLDAATASHVRSLMAEHLTDVTSSDQHTVKPWFNGRLDFTIPVKDFAEQGFPLVGGRLDYLQNHPVAALVYRHKQHFINVFYWPAEAGKNAPLSETSRRGYAIVEGTVSGLSVCAVSDLNAEELQQFVALLTKK